MRESDEDWWRGRRKESEEPSEEELNQFVGFSQVFKMIVSSVSLYTMLNSAMLQ